MERPPEWKGVLRHSSRDISALKGGEGLVNEGAPYNTFGPLCTKKKVQKFQRGSANDERRTL